MKRTIISQNLNSNLGMKSHSNGLIRRRGRGIQNENIKPLVITNAIKWASWIMAWNTIES